MKISEQLILQIANNKLIKLWNTHSMIPLSDTSYLICLLSLLQSIRHARVLLITFSRMLITRIRWLRGILYGTLHINCALYFILRWKNARKSTVTRGSTLNARKITRLIATSLHNALSLRNGIHTNFMPILLSPLLTHPIIPWPSHSSLVARMTTSPYVKDSCVEGRRTFRCIIQCKFIL